MSKARKRNRQPWWKANRLNREWRKRQKRNPQKLVRFYDVMRALYPRDVGAP